MAEICHVGVDAKMLKRNFLKKRQFTAMVSNVYWRPTLSRTWACQRTHCWTPKILKIDDVILFCRGWSNLDKILQTGAEWHVDCGDMAEIKTRSRIPIWRTLGRIQWHVTQSHLPYSRELPRGEFNVITPELRVTLQGAATWRIRWHVIPEPCVVAG